MHPDFTRASAHAQFDLAAFRSVLRCVGQQVREYLLQTYAIGTNKHGHVKDMLDETVSTSVEERTHAFRCIGDGFPDIDQLKIELDLAGADARYVEQIVREPI